MADPDTHRRSDRIREEIRHTRAEMDGTVDELSRRLSPGHLLDEVWARIRTGNGDGLGSVIKNHPMPVALMGLGLGWLAVEQASGDDADVDDPGTHGRAEGRRGPYRGDAVDHDDPDWEHADATTRAKAKAKGAAGSVKDAAGDAASAVKGAAGSVKDAAGDAASSVKGAASSAKDRVTDAAGSARDSASDLSRRASDKGSHAASAARRGVGRAAGKASDGFSRLLEEQPLALGALAFGLGLASGLAAPSTDREDRLMGRTADTVKDEAGRVAREAGGRAGRVATETAGAVADEARRQREERDFRSPAEDSLEQLEESAEELASEAEEAVREVASTAKEAAREAAREEDLTAEGLKKEARTAAERTRRQAEKDVERV